MSAPKQIRMADPRKQVGRQPYPPGVVSDPYNQRAVPTPRATGIAYPGTIDPVTPMQRSRNAGPQGKLDDSTLEGQVAPPTQIERYPIIIGRNLTFETVSSRFRLALTGYRQLYVDILNELIERDPHCYAVVAKRANMVANAKYTATPPSVADEEEQAGQADKAPAKLADKPPFKGAQPKDQTKKPKTNKGNTKRDKAQQIADELQEDFEKIPRRKEHLRTLAWADFYALMGVEVMWTSDERTGRWRPRDLCMIHSRRLSYPDPWNWDLYIWDQGAVIGQPFGDVQLPPGIFGWRVADYPGKFVIHAPQIRADYPTREGLGRELAYWMVLKHTAMRAAPEYLERFSNPPTDITYATHKEDGMHRPASDEDIDNADAAMRAGVMRGWVHPDSIKWEIKPPEGLGGRAKVTFVEWAKFCDDQMTKATLGSTLGTDVGDSGSRALGGEQRKDTLAIIQLSAESLADSLDEVFVRTWCELNYPDDEELWPHMQASVEDDPDPLLLMQRAVAGVSMGMPIDADEMADLTGMPLVDPDDPDARVLKPVKQSLPTELPLAPVTAANSPEAQEEREAQAQELEQQKADQAHQRGMEMLQTKIGAQPAPPPGGAKGTPPKAATKPQPSAPSKKMAEHDPMRASIAFTDRIKTIRDLGVLTQEAVDAVAQELGVSTFKVKE